MTVKYARAYSSKTEPERAIKKLTELFAERRHLPIEQQKDYVRLQWPQILSGGHLNLWRIGDPVIALPRRVLLGIATWSLYDLKLLDSLTGSLNLIYASDERVDVFDVDEGIDSRAPEVTLKNAFQASGEYLIRPSLGFGKTES